ncbi:FAD-dependent oxidoreductase [Clostridium sp.]|uniref:NAD(P)/FAD-dependent oxidoreductase n=1 Tax=Clostridium sp. TaxID=1506 RepID=UPI0032165909
MKEFQGNYDVVILGGGPAGLAAGLGAYEKGANTLIVEREERLGGILKQCIHDGFGLINFKEKLSGPEYAYKYIKEVEEKNIPVYTKTFVVKVEKIDAIDNGENTESSTMTSSKNNRDSTKKIFKITLVNEENGVFHVLAKSLVLANGCRERTSRQVFINGERPVGVYTAGTAQYIVNILGYLPCKNCVILGSGDIGLIMARRLTLEGSKVVGVYEAKPTPSGLSRNISQCLDDFSIPLHLSHTVTKIIGQYRVEAVEISKVDEKMIPIKGTEEIVECDGLILSVGLIPENEIAETLGVEIDKNTKGPVVDQNFMTSISGVFSCGNALHVNDLVDYVSESGKYAGENAATYVKSEEEVGFITINASSKDFLYVVPQKINYLSRNEKITLYFRSKEVRKNVKVKLSYKNTILFRKTYSNLKPPEMERIEFNIEDLDFNKDTEEVLKLIIDN